MNFSGVFAAMVTPLSKVNSTSNLSYKDSQLEILCDFLIKNGVDGLFILGTTGEGVLLSIEERKKITEKVVKYVNKRTKVIVHTGALTKEHTIELSQHAKSIDADAISIITPFFYKLDELSILEYYTTLAKELSGFPLFIYNLPSVTNNNISPELLMRIVRKADNIVGLKNSSNDLIQFREYRKKMGKDFILLMGFDGLILDSLFEGGNGCVSGNASAIPEVVVNLYKFFNQGQFDEAKKLQYLLDKLRSVIEHRNTIAYLKKILELRGLNVGGVRSPLRNITIEEEKRLKRLLEKLIPELTPI